MDFKEKARKIFGNPREISYILLGIYAFVLFFFILRGGMNLKIDFVFLILFLAALIIGRKKAPLGDWIPFVFVLLSYGAMRCIPDNFGTSAHVWEMIKVDRFFFGQIPSVFLQNKLWHAESLSWYDAVCFFLYLSHFWYFLLVGSIIWIKKREYFRIFSWGFIILCALGFLTYLLFPAMAPWDASGHNYIEKTEKIFFLIAQKMDLGGITTLIYHLISPNQVASMPSMHAAWAWFSSLFLIYFFGRKFLPVFLYPAALFFALVYMGEHYVIDLIVGVIYASFVFWFSKSFLDKESRSTG